MNVCLTYEFRSSLRPQVRYSCGVIFFLLKVPSFDFRFRDTRHRHLRVWYVCIGNGHAGDTGQRR